MRLLLVAGSHPRHRAIVDSILNSGFFSEVFCLVMERESLEPTSHLVSHCNSEEEVQLLKHHFHLRNRAETAAFGDHGLSELPGKSFRLDSCCPSSLNTAVEGVLKEFDPQVFIAVGPGMFSESVLRRLPAEAFNVHLGLSPRYRGSATLFWPSYFLEPWFSGVTFHRFDSTPDSGGILHQSIPNLKRGMSVHDSAIAAITSGIVDFPTLLGLLIENPGTRGIQQGVGKTFLVKDFRATHLVPVYKLFGGYVIDYLLSHRIGSLPTPPRTTTFADWWK